MPSPSVLIDETPDTICETKVAALVAGIENTLPVLSLPPMPPPLLSHKLDSEICPVYTGTKTPNALLPHFTLTKYLLATPFAIVDNPPPPAVGLNLIRLSSLDVFIRFIKLLCCKKIFF